MVTVNSGEFPLMRNIDMSKQPQRSHVYAEWSKAFNDRVPWAIDNLANVIEDIYTYELWKERQLSGPEEMLERFGIIGLDLDNPAKLIRELRKKNSSVKRKLLERNIRIRAEREAGKTQQQIADEVGLSQNRVSEILSEKPAYAEKTDKPPRKLIQYKINAGTHPRTAALKIRQKFGDEFANALKLAL
jgi:hypothetical protein